MGQGRGDATVSEYTKLAAMKVLVTGSTGLIGSALVPFLESKGHQVLRLTRVRTPENNKSILWNPDTLEIERERCEGMDAVVHLAGENISKGRWTIAQKHRILDSRAKGTWFLSKTLAGLKNPPKAFVSSSAIGIYGDRGDEELTEQSARGEGFLAEVVQAWEQATIPAQKAGIRVVHMRQGIVLSPRGGALGKMLLPFRLGVGGRLGSGNQSMSWIGLPELLEIYSYALENAGIVGPVNCVSPNPVTNIEFTKILGKVLWRPTLFPAPSWILKLVLGQMADELLLAGQKVEPKRLMDHGYEFKSSDLETTLRGILG